MREICIPIQYLPEQEIADVEVSVSGKKIRYNFRIESFPWELNNEFATLKDPLERSLARIYQLKAPLKVMIRIGNLSRYSIPMSMPIIFMCCIEKKLFNKMSMLNT